MLPGMFSIYMYNLLITGHSYKGCSLNYSEKKISPSINLASQHLSIDVLNSMCSVGETTTQSLVHHVCLQIMYSVGVKCNEMSDILLTSKNATVLLSFHNFFFHFYEKSY